MDLENMPVDIFDAGIIGTDLFANGSGELNLDFSLTEGELKELDATELETLLNEYEDIDAAEILFGSDRDPVELLYPTTVEPIVACNSTSVQPMVVEEFPQSDIHADITGASHRKDTASVLLIAIPEQMQVDPAFDSITSINLERKSLNKIADASTGHDGVYLPISQLPVSDVMIVRRPPLRVIPHVSNSFPIQSAEVPVKAEPGKRKQTFNLTRDDRVEFSSVGYSRLRPKESIRKTSRYQCFKWASSDEEETEDAIEDADEPNRCPGCKKVFKKLEQHKCKKMIPTVDAAVEPYKLEVDGNSLMFCGTCHKSFKSKKGLLAHMKKCFAKKAVESHPEPFVQKRSLRSGVKK